MAQKPPQIGYQHLLPNGFVICSTRAEHAVQLEELQNIVFPLLEPTERLRKEHYLKHIELFPEGQFVALDGTRVIGMTTTLRLSEKTIVRNHTFAEVTQGGFCTSHEPLGEWMYGVDVGTHPDYRRRGITRALYQARHETCRRLGLKGQYSMGMLNGFAAVKDRYTLDEYYTKVVAKEVVDPTVSIQMRIGFQIKGLARDYLNDPTCGDACVRLTLRTETAIEDGDCV
jgi:GNAT superfamily N-acetyltransferase